MRFRTLALALALCTSFTVAAEAAAKRKPVAVRHTKPAYKYKSGKSKAPQYKTPKYKAHKYTVTKRKHV